MSDRRAAGRAARQRIARGELGRWDPAARTDDPLALIVEQNTIRLPELAALRRDRMAESPWAFYRGAAAVMAADLATRPDTDLIVQLCGDAHILNFGLWATPERNLSFDLRDFDETIHGPFEWDVCRLAASIIVLAREAGLSERRGRRAVAACVESYRERMASYATARQLDIWYDLITDDHLVSLFKPVERERAMAHIQRQAKRRTNRGAVRKLTEVVDGHLHITDDPPRRVHLDEQSRWLVAELFGRYRTTLQEDRRVLLDHFVLVDAVRQVVGVGSVGIRVYLVLLEGRDGADPLLLQIKQAGPSVYERHGRVAPKATHGERVVSGKRLIQSATDIFVGWASLDGHDFYVRQFRDMKVIPDIETVAPRLAEFATACGAVLARAHARTGDPVAVSAYIGSGRRFDEALGEFAVAYADQNERDQRVFAAMARSV